MNPSAVAAGIGAITTLLTAVLGSIGWWVKRRAAKRDEAEKARLERAAKELGTDASLQQIASDNVRYLLGEMQKRIEALHDQQTASEDRWQVERGRFEKRLQEMEDLHAGERQRDKARIRDLEKCNRGLEERVRNLEDEVSQYQRPPDARTRATDRLREDRSTVARSYEMPEDESNEIVRGVPSILPPDEVEKIKRGEE